MGDFLKCPVFDLKGSLGLTFLRIDCISGNKWRNLCSGYYISWKMTHIDFLSFAEEFPQGIYVMWVRDSYIQSSLLYIFYTLWLCFCEAWVPY